MDVPTTNPLLAPPELSPLEQEVLEEYERLAENMKNVRSYMICCIALSIGELVADY